MFVYKIKSVLLVVIALIISLSLKSQVDLIIVINNLENDIGHVVLDLRDGNNKSVKSIFHKIENRKCIISFKNLDIGTYSFKYFHDENDNKKLDTYWVGAPKEGYGFSNNAKGKFGPPDFDKTTFKLKSDTTIICIPKYIEMKM